MCGIGGILRVHPPGTPPPPPEVAIPEGWLDIIDESVKHRGPDGQGRFRDRVVRADGCTVDVAFVHRRLSIIDHAGGGQPMVQGGPALISREGGPYRVENCHVCPRCRELGVRASSPTVREGVASSAAPDAVRAHSDTLAVVFNGCIYNHRELRKELQAAGHVFESDHSDTEVLLHGWREWQGNLHGHLDGMFAWVIWDAACGEIVLARDSFGEKPLYHSQANNGTARLEVFASTCPALLRLNRLTPQFAQAWNVPWRDTLDPWISYGWQSHVVTPGIRCVDPGETRSEIEGIGGLGDDEGSWGWAMTPTRRSFSVTEVDAALRASVAHRLEADVEVGCFLSGGIDSSLMATYASELRPDISAYSVRMPSAAFDESPFAQRVASVLGVRLTTLDCEARPSEDLPALISQLGLPFGDSSLLPTYWVSRATRQFAKVAISGDGGDEMFLGYDRHAALKWLWRFGKLPSEVVSEMASRLTADSRPKSARTRLSRLLNAAAHQGYKDLVAIFPEPYRTSLGLGSLTAKHWGMTPRGGMGSDIDEWMRWQLRFDRMFYLPDDLLRKADTASMAVALEVRAPFLARDVAKKAMTAPLSSLMPHNQRKGLLRAVARKYFPAEIVDRPKMGFAIPIGEWFRTDYGGMKPLLMDHLESVEPWGSPTLGIDLNMKFVRQMVDEHMNHKRDHSQRLYMLLVLSIWAKWLSGLGGPSIHMQPARA